MKVYLPLIQNDFPFSQVPHHVELEDDNILCNDVTLPYEYNPHSIKLWVIGDVYGAIVAVWAECEQDAFDIACDANMLDGYINDGMDEEDCVCCGNAGEYFYLDQAWIGIVRWKDLDEKTKLAFAYSKGAGYDTLKYP